MVIRFSMAITLTFVQSLLPSFAQTYYYQDFENGMPNNITLVNRDGNTPNVNVNNFTSAWIGGFDYDDPSDGVANSTSWYSPAGTADDWMILPAITVGKHAQLTWVAQAPDFVYPDGYEVYIGNSSIVDSLIFNPPVFSIAAENAIDTDRSISLSAYAYETIYIAFRNNSFDKFVLTIDDIMVFETPDNDVGIVDGGFLPPVYSEIPASIKLKQKLFAVVTNGGLLTSSFETEVAIKQNGVTLFTNNIPFTLLGPGETIEINLGNYIFSDTGQVLIEYQITPIGLDVNVANNYLSRISFITEEYLLKDDRVINGSLGLGRNIKGLLGNSYLLSQTVYLSGVQVFIDPYNFGTMSGQYVKAVVYDMNEQGPKDVIAKTDSVLINGAGPHVIDLSLEQGAVNVGNWFGVFIEEGDSNSTLAYSNNIFTKKTGWVYYNGFWANNEDYGFDITYQIRPKLSNMGTTGISQNLYNKESTIEVSLFPNPCNDVIQVNLINKDELIQSIRVYNSIGQLIAIQNLIGANNFEMKTYKWQKGSYLIHILTNEKSINQKVVKQ